MQEKLASQNQNAIPGFEKKGGRRGVNPLPPPLQFFSPLTLFRAWPQAIIFPHICCSFSHTSFLNNCQAEGGSKKPNELPLDPSLIVMKTLEAN